MATSKARTAILLALLLTACDQQASNHAMPSKACEAQQEKVYAWLQRIPRTIPELEEEILTVMGDNNCGLITPAVIRKLMIDQVRILGSKPL